MGRALLWCCMICKDFVYRCYNIAHYIVHNEPMNKKFPQNINKEIKIPKACTSINSNYSITLNCRFIEKIHGLFLAGFRAPSWAASLPKFLEFCSHPNTASNLLYTYIYIYYCTKYLLTKWRFFGHLSLLLKLPNISTSHLSFLQRPTWPIRPTHLIA